MKKVLFFVLVFFVSGTIFCQTAYKNYNWSMSPDQVREICPDIRSIDLYFQATVFSFYYVYYDQLSSYPDPLRQETGRTTKFQSRSENLYFYFVDSKLVCVEVAFTFDDILPELQRQYGNKTLRQLRYSGNTYNTITWNNDPNRYIVYYNDRVAYQSVSYFNGRWLKSLFDKTISEINASQSSSRSRLD